jgi:hypothetical protein
VGECFFRLDFGVAVGVGVSSSCGVGVGEALCFAFGDGLGAGDGLADFRLCFRWLGVGVGVAKKSLIFSPNDGSAAEIGAAGVKRKTAKPAANHFVRQGAGILN